MNDIKNNAEHLKQVIVGDISTITLMITMKGQRFSNNEEINTVCMKLIIEFLKSF